MSIKDFLKDRLVFLIVNFVLLMLLSAFFIFIRVRVEFVVIVILVWILPITSLLAIQYIERKKYYTILIESNNSLDKKYILPEVIEKADFFDGNIFYEILRETSRSMNEEIKKLSKDQSDYREYIEAWVHEVKTPIASSNLIIDNNKNSITKSIKDELTKVEGYVEQVLYYSRSSDANKDYIIKEFNLSIIIKNIITKNSKYFIHKKVKLELGDVDKVVYSDSKWVEFILNQILTNAIKYCDKEDSIIKIFTERDENNIVLSIIDNGVGISEKDIKRVFDKGFTGENGRKFARSTGMGLYICKKLADKLSIGIDIESKISQGTCVRIIFPVSKYVLLEN